MGGAARRHARRRLPRSATVPRAERPDGRHRVARATTGRRARSRAERPDSRHRVASGRRTARAVRVAADRMRLPGSAQGQRSRPRSMRTRPLCARMTRNGSRPGLQTTNVPICSAPPGRRAWPRLVYDTKSSTGRLPTIETPRCAGPSRRTSASSASRMPLRLVSSKTIQPASQPGASVQDAAVGGHAGVDAVAALDGLRPGVGEAAGEVLGVDQLPIALEVIPPRRDADPGQDGHQRHRDDDFGQAVTASGHEMASDGRREPGVPTGSPLPPSRTLTPAPTPRDRPDG